MKSQHIEKYNQLSQREKKYAKTKIALLNAMLTAIKTQPLSTIRLKDLSNQAEVSEPTFFNYFDSKQHILIYFIQLWSLEMSACAQASEAEHSAYIEIIKDIFSQTSQRIVQLPQIMLEIIAFQSQQSNLHPHAISDAEKWLFFPNIKDIDKLEGQGLESILPPLIDKAIAAGELHKSCDSNMLFLTLSSLFFGTALLTLKDSPEIYPDCLNTQLETLFESLK